MAGNQCPWLCGVRAWCMMQRAMAPSIIMVHWWVTRWLNSAFYRCTWHSANQDPISSGIAAWAVYFFMLTVIYRVSIGFSRKSYPLEKMLRTSSAIYGFNASSPTNFEILLSLVKSISMEQSYFRDAALTILANTSALVSSLAICMIAFMTCPPFYEFKYRWSNYHTFCSFSQKPRRCCGSIECVQPG